MKGCDLLGEWGFDGFWVDVADGSGLKSCLMWC